MPVQVARAAAQTPQPKTNRNRNSSSALKPDIRIFKNMLPRINPQIRRKLSIAKTIVASGAAAECELQAAYAIGVAEPVSLAVSTNGTAKIGEDRIIGWIKSHYDLRPAGMIERFDLRRPIYLPSAGYGAFGRMDVTFPWEIIDQDALADLRKLI